MLGVLGHFSICSAPVLKLSHNLSYQICTLNSKCLSNCTPDAGPGADLRLHRHPGRRQGPEDRQLPRAEQGPETETEGYFLQMVSSHLAGVLEYWADR